MSWLHDQRPVVVVDNEHTRSRGIAGKRVSLNSVSYVEECKKNIAVISFIAGSRARFMTIDEQYLERVGDLIEE